MRIKFASQKGAAMVEFALLLIPLVLITFGIIEFGLLLFNQQVVTNATREGARAGVVYKLPTRMSENEIKGVVNNYAKAHLVTFGDINSLVIYKSMVYSCPSTTPSPLCTGAYDPGAAAGSNLRVVIQYKYKWLVLPNFMSINEDYGAETVMRFE